METEEFRNIWEEAIRSCELESNEKEAKSFVRHYYNNDSVFKSMNDRNLLLTFVGLVVYEKKYQIKLGSTTPASFCYSELLRRVDKGSLDRDFIYDVGDWAADYSDMGTFLWAIIEDMALDVIFLFGTTTSDYCQNNKQKKKELQRNVRKVKRK